MSGDPHFRFWNRARIAAVAGYLICAAGLGFNSPGLFYDEAIFLNGAVQMLHSPKEPTFAHDKWSWFEFADRHWPVMVLPYVGPIRSYLALLPFALFGPNNYTARILTTLIGAFALWGFGVLVRGLFDTPTAAIVSWILAIHPSYLALTIYDQGGVAEWMLPFGLICLALARYLKTPGAGGAFWLGAAMGFGVWCRANITWLLGFGLLAAVLVLRKRVLIPGRHLGALVLGGLLGGLPLLIYEFNSGWATFEFMRVTNNTEPWPKLLLMRMFMIIEMLLTDGEHRFIWSGPPMPVWQAVLFPLIVIVAVVTCLKSFREIAPERKSLERIAALLFMFLLTCMVFSRLNISHHHLIATLPIVVLMVVLASQDLRPRWPRAASVVWAVSAIYVGLAIYWNVEASRHLRATGGIGLWSDAIEVLCQDLESHYPGRKVKVLDWGLNNSLFVLSGGRIDSLEIFGGATAERSGSGKTWKEEIAPGDIYVLHSKDLTMSPSVPADFFAALRSMRLNFRRRDIAQRGGEPYAEIIEIPQESATKQAN